MTETLIFLDPKSGLNLQSQIRQKLLEGIQKGTLIPGKKLPSSRKLAEQIGVSRNTVTLAYEQLIEEGVLVSRARSGIFVEENLNNQHVGFQASDRKKLDTEPRWRKRFRTTINTDHYYTPDDINDAKYPFVDGYFDSSLLPISQWREATRMVLGSKQLEEQLHSSYADDPKLLHEIRTKILPRRGINASDDEILVTVSHQQSLYLLTELLVDHTVRIALEEPGCYRMRSLCQDRHAQICLQEVDEGGLVIDADLDSTDIIYSTPSHQNPTGVTLHQDRRNALIQKAAQLGQLIIEDDSVFESNYMGRPNPALRSMDANDRVIYISALPALLKPGLGLGFIVASKTLISELRKLRHVMTGVVPLTNQRTAATFLSLGHYDALMMRMTKSFSERWNALRNALLFYLAQYVVTMPNQGGTSFWVKGPENIDMDVLYHRAKSEGVLIEPVYHYYDNPLKAGPYFRMGITSIQVHDIRKGVEILANLILKLNKEYSQTIDEYESYRLDSQSIREQMSDITMMLTTVYGEPNTIILHADGTMTGTCGHHDEEQDTGRWWVEGDYWCRQWNEWAYGEVSRLQVAVKENKIRFFRPSGRFINIAEILS